MRAAALSLVIGAGLLAVAVFDTGSAETRHVIRSNLVPPLSFVAAIPGGAEACQRRELVPGAAGAVRLRVGTFEAPGPPLDVTVRRDATVLRGGGIAAGWTEGDVVVPLAGTRGDDTVAGQLCVRNGGARRIVVAGALETPAGAARVRGTAEPGRMSVGYLEGEPRSWWSFAGGLGGRVEAVRDAVPGGASVILWLACVGFTVAGAVVLVLRAGRS